MAPGEETARLLSRVPLFADLSPEDLEQLAHVAVPRSYAPGETVFREGDTGDTCYVVRSGAVRVTRRHSDGRVITLAELRPGDIFGELAMFGGEVRSATVEALSDARAIAILAADLRRLLLAHPDIAVKMLVGLANRLRTDQRADRAAVVPDRRRAGGERAARPGAGAQRRGRAGTREVLIQATQAEIAQLAGASRESASRFLAKLERAGLISHRARKGRRA